MGYCEALEKAGAEVLAYEEFGSYQGDWWAAVLYNGKKFWVHGSFGSCSGCDSYQAEFPGWDDDEYCGEHRYFWPKPQDCALCDVARDTLRDRIAEFGRGYLSNEWTQAEAEKEAATHESWDASAAQVVEFIRKNAVA